MLKRRPPHPHGATASFFLKGRILYVTWFIFLLGSLAQLASFIHLFDNYYVSGSTLDLKENYITVFPRSSRSLGRKNGRHTTHCITWQSLRGAEDPETWRLLLLGKGPLEEMMLELGFEG